MQNHRVLPIDQHQGADDRGASPSSPTLAPSYGRLSEQNLRLSEIGRTSSVSCILGVTHVHSNATHNVPQVRTSQQLMNTFLKHSLDLGLSSPGAFSPTNSHPFSHPREVDLETPGERGGSRSKRDNIQLGWTVEEADSTRQGSTIGTNGAWWNAQKGGNSMSQHSSKSYPHGRHR